MKSSQSMAFLLQQPYGTKTHSVYSDILTLGDLPTLEGRAPSGLADSFM